MNSITPSYVLEQIGMKSITIILMMNIVSSMILLLSTAHNIEIAINCMLNVVYQITYNLSIQSNPINNIRVIV